MDIGVILRRFGREAGCFVYGMFRAGAKDTRKYTPSSPPTCRVGEAPGSPLKPSGQQTSNVTKVSGCPVPSPGHFCHVAFFTVSVTAYTPWYTSVYGSVRHDRRCRTSMTEPVIESYK